MNYEAAVDVIRLVVNAFIAKTVSKHVYFGDIT